MIRIGLVSTTVNVPKVLTQYRRLARNHCVGFFIAGDLKTDAFAQDYLGALQTGFEKCKGASGTFYLSPTAQKELGYKSSELIGWNTDSRRNIAVLEALKWGADFLISIDDDMIPFDSTFFDQIAHILGNPFSGLQLGAPSHWFDAGNLTCPRYRQRGLPSFFTPDDQHEFVTDVQIGAMQGIILGTPDTDAATTIAHRGCFVSSASDVLKQGFVTHPQAKCVFNSQITAFRRELAPAFAQFYKWQRRNTDIIASVLMRRIMRERGLYTYFGPPMDYHARAPREPQKDMNSEQWGLNKIGPLQDYLDNTDVLRDDDICVTHQLRRIYEDMLTFDMFPRENVECALAWISDCESVL